MDITPTYPILPADQEVVLPTPFASDGTAQTVGGFMASPSSLSAGNVTYNAQQEQILVGQASATLTGIGVFIGNAGDGTYDFRAGDPSGNYIQWDASIATLTVKGTITATAGTIGGFSLGADYIRDAANSFGLASTVTGGDDVRFWSGDTFANRATAPFRVTEAGAVTASNIVATGTINAQGGYLGAPTTVLNISTSGLDVGTTGHIQGGQSGYNTGVGFYLGYSGAAYKFSLGNPSGNYITWDGTSLTISGVQQVIKNFTAAEALTQGKPVFVMDGTETRNLSQSTKANTVVVMGDAGGNTPWCGQTFTAPAESIVLNQVTLSLNRNVSSVGPGGNVLVDIYATSGGFPTGSSLASSSTSLAASAVSGAQTDYNFTFNYTMTPGTVYAIVVHGITGSGGNNITVWGNSGSGSGLSTSSNGSAWSTSANNAAYNIARYTFGGSGQVAMTSTDSTNSPGQYVSFIGFVYATTSKGGQVPIVVSGSAIGLSGLTLKGQYYLNDGSGTIGTSAGSNTRKCGIALSATELLITNLW